MALPETIAAIIGGATIRAAILAQFDFASGTERVWSGEGELTAGGYVWKGMGRYGSVDGLSTRTDMSAESLSFVLSGVDPTLVSLAQNSAHEAKGRTCAVYVQFFDVDWSRLDSPYALRSGIMDQMKYRATGPNKRSISLTAEGLFAFRGAAPFAYYTDRDQEARWSGDTFFKLIPTLLVKQITWPDF